MSAGSGRGLTLLDLASFPLEPDPLLTGKVVVVVVMVALVVTIVWRLLYL